MAFKSILIFLLFISMFGVSDQRHQSGIRLNISEYLSFIILIAFKVYLPPASIFQQHDRELFYSVQSTVTYLLWERCFHVFISVFTLHIYTYVAEVLVRHISVACSPGLRSVHYRLGKNQFLSSVQCRIGILSTPVKAGFRKENSDGI